MEITEEVRDTIRDIVKEEIANSVPSKRKGNRTPSKWQVFLKHCTPKQIQNLSMGEKVKACSVQYKEIKVKNGKLLDDMLAKYMEEKNKNQIQDQPNNKNQIQDQE